MGGLSFKTFIYLSTYQFVCDIPVFPYYIEGGGGALISFSSDYAQN